MAPLIKQFDNFPEFLCKVCVTAQHRVMLDQVLEFFNIVPDYDLNIMKSDQTLNEITSKVLTNIKPVLDDFQPDLVLVHGDTATTFAASLAAYYEKIDIGHIEAGLRTGNIYSPWPEEINRKLTTSIARLHFAPTLSSKKNLLFEGIDQNKIFLTGNTVIDALISVKKSIISDKSLADHLKKQFNFIDFSKQIILVTGHRRENFGGGFVEICKGISSIASNIPDVEIVYPVHLNPNVKEPVSKILGGFKNIHLIEPLDYLPFVYLMMHAKLILTDSGGIQEEAPVLGKPVLVMRNNTERSEAVASNTAKLVGANCERIFSETAELLKNESAYMQMSSAKNPFGDGSASFKIVTEIKKYFELTLNSEEI